MTKHNKADEFRLYTTEEQVYLMRKAFSCVSFVYNRIVAEPKEAYEKYNGDKEQRKKQKSPTLFAKTEKGTYQTDACLNDRYIEQRVYTKNKFEMSYKEKTSCSTLSGKRKNDCPNCAGNRIFL